MFWNARMKSHRVPHLFQSMTRSTTCCVKANMWYTRHTNIHMLLLLTHFCIIPRNCHGATPIILLNYTPLLSKRIPFWDRNIHSTTWDEKIDEAESAGTKKCRYVAGIDKWLKKWMRSVCSGTLPVSPADYRELSSRQFRINGKARSPRLSLSVRGKEQWENRRQCL